MSLIANGAGEQPTGFYNGVATQSLRLDDGSSAYLTRTPSSAGNRRTFTFSAWVKRGPSLATTDKVIFNAGTGNAADFRIRLSDTNFFDLLSYNGSSYDFNIRTNQVFRDVSAWYHIVVAFDTTQGTAANRIKVYVNGTQVTSFSTATYPSENFQGFINSTEAHAIGRYTWADGAYFDAYMAEVNFIDGTALAPSSFGETKNGIWIPIDTSGLTFGTNGFRLKFDQVGVGTASTSTIGADTSGNNHHFTSSGIVASDCNMPDCPENNFCTWNPLSASASQGAVKTLSEGNLQFSGGAFAVVGGTMSVTSGKWYWETKLLSTVNGSNPFVIGFVSANTIAHSSSHDQSVVMYSDNGSGKLIQHIENSSITQNITIPSALLTFDVNDVMQFAYDGDTGKIWVGKNNTYVANDGGTDGNPSNGSNQTFTLADTTIPMTPLADHGGVAWTGLANFGQLTNAYTAPTDFNPLSTANLPEPTIGPNSGANEQSDDYFNTVLYTGTGSSQAITGVGFQPDWVWTKGRSVAYSHYLFDSSRGVQKRLMTNNSNAEDTLSNGLTAFGTDGFTHGGEAGMGENTKTFVAWNWKANGGTTTTNDASSTSVGTIDSVIQANPEAGFSIVTYTGFSGNNGTGAIAHGLGVAPSMIIHKSRTRASGWWTQVPNFLSHPNVMLNLGSNAAGLDLGGYGTMSVPDTSVFSINGVDGIGGESANYVAYCFANVEGYSKIGSYTGNGAADGPFVYTGFRPAFLLMKRTDATGYWAIWDAVRDVDNAVINELTPNSNDAETTAAGVRLDILSNGFKLRNSGAAYNASGSPVIYMAFAEAPFKYANAR